MIDFFNQQEF